MFWFGKNEFNQLYYRLKVNDGCHKNNNESRTDICFLRDFVSFVSFSAGLFNDETLPLPIPYVGVFGQDHIS